jgi:hypothetical protein
VGGETIGKWEGKQSGSADFFEVNDIAATHNMIILQCIPIQLLLIYYHHYYHYYINSRNSSALPVFFSPLLVDSTPFF